MATTTYQIKLGGKTSDGKNLSKSFASVSEFSQENATTLNTKVVKLYDSGTTLTSATHTTNVKYDTSATA